MARYKDYAGVRYPGSKIVWIRRTGERSRHGHNQWLGQCDCGEPALATTDNVPRMQSCGCLCLKHDNYVRKDPYEYLHKKNILERHDNTYGPPIDVEGYTRLARMNCYLCNAIPNNEDEAHVQSLRYQGIDRENNLFSYQPFNCRPCCWWCNNGKADRSLAEHKENILRSAVHLFTPSDFDWAYRLANPDD